MGKTDTWEPGGPRANYRRGLCQVLWIRPILEIALSMLAEVGGRGSHPYARKISGTRRSRGKQGSKV